MKAALLSVLTAAFLAGAAFAEPPEAALTASELPAPPPAPHAGLGVEALLLQRGANNVGVIDQRSATAAEAWIFQSGEQNAASVAQTGAGNRARLVQIGNANTLDLTQSGDANGAMLKQTGDGMALSVTQTGGAVVMITQTGG